MQAPKLQPANLRHKCLRHRALTAIKARCPELACGYRELEYQANRICGASSLAYERFIKRILARLRTTPALKTHTAVEICHICGTTATRKAPEPALNCVPLVMPEYEGNVGMEQCRKCKSRDVEMTSRQVRGADEGMTTYLRCRRCGQRWTN